MVRGLEPAHGGRMGMEWGNVCDNMKTELTQYQARRMNAQQLPYDLQNLWALITGQPGMSLRRIAATMGITVYRSRLLVRLLLQSGTLVKEDGKGGTLRATVPLITKRR